MEKYKYAGQKLKIKEGAGISTFGEELGGKEFIAEDYWINLPGNVSWMNSVGNPACIEYALRTGLNKNYKIPEDDKAVYGKVGPFGHLFHESELEIMDKDKKL